MEKKNFDNLEFMRITDPTLIRFIPRDLLEQIKDISFDIDRFYATASAFMGPATFMYLLVEDQTNIKGFLWFFVNVLDSTAHVNTLTIDKEYQGSDAIRKTAEFIKELGGKLKIQITTSRPQVFEKAGFEKSNSFIMEIK